MSANKHTTLWSGRFTARPDEAAWRLNASLPVDRRLASQDVRGSAAWASALRAAGVLTGEQHAAIQGGLEQIAAELERGQFAFAEGDEDIHTAVERRLGELIGTEAGRLHTGRSRNDQVATDLRLWLLDHIPSLDAAARGLQAALVALAERHAGTVMPGYTHLQRAQPVTLGHWLLSHFWALQRDRQRLAELRARVAVLPLGSGALAGTSFAVDRAVLAAALGFDSPAPNSIDAVADRDFAAEFLFWAALTGVHLSRLSEAVVLFSSAEFGFFELDDAFATGSSLMPQKKNPDLFELARGKAGTLIGLLAGLLAALKGLPSAYDKDLQEDKAPVFQAADTLLAVLPALAGALETLRVHPGRMRAAVDAGMMATDLADELVRAGVPFRAAHEAAGRAVRRAAELGVSLEQQPEAEWQRLGLSGAELGAAFDPEASVRRRNAAGGTAPESVQAQIKQAKSLIQGED